MNPKYECRVCKDATECTNVWKDENEEFMNCSAFVAPPPTNADKIRSMNDEEMAEFVTSDFCELLCDSPYVCNGDCATRMIEWLKEEVK